MSRRVLVTGSHGLIGAALVAHLEARGDDVRRLVRSRQFAGEDVFWDPGCARIEREKLGGFDAVVHLAGEPLTGRWTRGKRQRIRDSRVNGTALLARELAISDAPPSVFVAASAVGFYGTRGSEPLTEEAAGGTGFLAEVVREWEAATAPLAEASVRTVVLRQGIVLSPAGGALARLLLPFRLGLGGRVASGRQYWAWIGLHELLRVFVRAIDDPDMRGTYNVVAPQAVTNAEFTRVLAAHLGRPAFLPAPAPALRLAFGAMADEMLLASQRVVPERLLDEGYDFQDHTLEQALGRELPRNSR